MVLFVGKNIVAHLGQHQYFLIELSGRHGLVRLFPPQPILNAWRFQSFLL